MARYRNWYLVEIYCPPRSRYTISDSPEGNVDTPYKYGVVRTFSGKNAEADARAEANRRNNEADRT